MSSVTATSRQPAVPIFFFSRVSPVSQVREERSNPTSRAPMLTLDKAKHRLVRYRGRAFIVRPTEAGLVERFPIPVHFASSNCYFLSHSISSANSRSRAVLRLGSSVPFSQDLNVLQEEVKPLWKLSSCARNFKRTTVERWFREAGFVLDWCSFRLIEENHNLHRESARRGPNMNVIGLPSSENSGHSEWRWARPTKSGTPTRSYLKETATTVFVPTALLLIFAGLLTTALCIHHEKMTDPESNEYVYELFNVFLRSSVTREKRELTPVEGLGNNGVQMVQYATSERGTLKSLSAQPSSPCDSLSRSPRTSVERCNPYVRPNPPPYMGPNNVTGVRADF
ncbi:uncharacterized protein LOC105700309 isoform X4 [Orussus abietinus]|uniref:uncharacterized protein LOC105700309 isoform X4 n=1 Tax=Orussus abietinus TaxID=222816 RepID=UPI00062544D0|nr:uncharacterized protein LOC105700309 isoform X4 [Orussus abietinus]